MTTASFRWAALLPGLFALACAGARSGPITDCEPRGRATPICGFQNPEDLALLPDGTTLVVSEYGSMEGGQAGRLSLLDLAGGKRSPLFAGGDAAPSDEDWGDAACPGPPGAGFSPHGIHLSRRADARMQLLVVQHGGRESVEMFELAQSPAGWRATWRGCAAAPPDSWLNDVVALPEGGFLVTHMLPRNDVASITSAYQGTPPARGHVLEWRPGAGFRVVAGTQSALPNGIELSPDGSQIFLNVSGGGEVWRIERASGEVSGRVPVRGPDNSTWAPDGRLLVASIQAGPEEFGTCRGLGGAPCPLPFQIVALDPRTLESEVLYRGGGAPLGAGTVGLLVGGELFVGSFTGDRVLRVRLD